MKKRNLIALTCMAMLLMGCGKEQFQPSTDKPSPTETSTVATTSDDSAKEASTEATDDSAKEASTEVTKADIDAYILEPAGIPIISSEADPGDTPLYFTYDGKESDDFISYDNLTLVNNGQNATSDEVAYGELYKPSNKCFRFKTDAGKEYIYIELNCENDYFQLAVFDITDGTAKFVGDNWFAYIGVDNEASTKDGYTDPSHLRLGSRSDSFGTFSYSVVYKVGEDGMPTPAESGCTIEDVCTEKVTSKKALDLEVVDSDGNPTGNMITVPAGSTYTLVNYYEDIPALDTKLDDGTVVRIPLSETGYEAKFNGTLIRDLFDELMYVG